MKILGVLALFGAMNVYAGTNPANDIYSDSLTIQRSSAEVPQAFAASQDDGKAIESVSDLIESSKAQPKKSARR